MKKILSMYRPGFAETIIYMLQSTEYESRPYLSWVWRVDSFSNVAKRRTLQRTKRAKLLLLCLRVGIASQVVLGLGVTVWGVRDSQFAVVLFGVSMSLLAPIFWAHAIVLPLVVAKQTIAKPKEKQAIADSKIRFAEHRAITIAVAGSYGKTTMKEFLSTILSEGKRVAATPGNKNVSASHASFARQLSGDEDVLVIEYGEGRPGDIARFAQTTQPDIGVITGIAPAHLDQYKTLDAAARDIFALADYVAEGSLYVNAESEAATDYIEADYSTYSRAGVDGWKVRGIKLSIDGTHFSMEKDGEILQLHSHVLGEHLIGPLAACVAIATSLGLDAEQIKRGVSKTSPYEHRMQPYSLGGGWVIDDTYNGNLEGVRAGLDVLVKLPAKRKVYVTPGLVEQGPLKKRVHEHIGQLIARAQPEVVVLMQNSTTEYIRQGLTRHGYAGEVRIVTEPKEFYENLALFVAQDDLVLLQNDWTDNYH